MSDKQEVIPAGEATPMLFLQPIATAQAKAHVLAVKQVMSAVMEKDKHYGVIPGTGDKPSLYQPGAQVLCMAFRIGARYETMEYERKGPQDPIFYQVTCTLFHQPTGTILGSGMGSANSHEEKYRWRRAVSKAEFDATPEHMRRMKFYKDGSAMQVERDPADIDNTLLKMGCKRAYIAAVLSVTAASDVFNQDLEDMSADLREAAAQPDAATGEVAEPQRKTTTGSAAKPAAKPAAAQRPAAAPSGGAAPAGKKAGDPVKKEDLPEGVDFHEGMAGAANLEALADIMNGLSPEDQKKFRPMFSYMRSVLGNPGE